MSSDLYLVEEKDPGVSLSGSTVGRIAELYAEARLLELGHQVARPSVDDGYDLVVDNRLTVQVKSSKLAFPAAGKYKERYRFHVFSNVKRNWSADFYLFHGRDSEKTIWWVVPGKVIRAEGAKGAISLYPGAKGRSERFEQYVDAWHLLA